MHGKGIPVLLPFHFSPWKILRMEVFDMEYSHPASSPPFSFVLERKPHPVQPSTLTFDIRRSTPFLRVITFLPDYLVACHPVTLSNSHCPPSDLFLENKCR
jgi:hypothetical protein